MKSKILKIVIILFVIGVIVGISVYMYVFHKPHRNIADEKPAFVLSATELLTQFSQREDSCNKVFGDKTLEIKGKIADITKKNNVVLTVVLENSTSGVNCNFDSAYSVENNNILNKFEIGNDVVLKGKCDGYDAISGVVLTSCALSDKK